MSTKEGFHSTCIRVSSRTIPLQDIPSLARVNPEKQSQVKDPWVLVQPCAQLSVPALHSSVSGERREHFVDFKQLSIVKMMVYDMAVPWPHYLRVVDVLPRALPLHRTKCLQLHALLSN